MKKFNLNLIKAFAFASLMAPTISLLTTNQLQADDHILEHAMQVSELIGLTEAYAKQLANKIDAFTLKNILNKSVCPALVEDFSQCCSAIQTDIIEPLDVLIQSTQKDSSDYLVMTEMHIIMNKLMKILDFVSKELYANQTRGLSALSKLKTMKALAHKKMICVAKELIKLAAIMQKTPSYEILAKRITVLHMQLQTMLS